MTRPAYWSDPSHRPPPAWVVPLVLAWSASCGYAIARFAVGLLDRRRS